MLKKIILIPMAVLLMVFAVGAASFAEDKKPGIIQMTLDEAIKYASVHNKTITDLEDQCKTKFETYNNEKGKTASISGPEKNNFSSMDEYAYYKGYKLTVAESVYFNLRNTTELTRQTTYYSIEKLAYDINQTEKTLDYLRKNKEKLEKDLSIAELKLKLKMINELQLNQAKLAVSQNNTILRQTFDGLTIKKNTLKTLLGIDRSVTLTIKVGGKAFTPLGEVNLDDLKKLASEKRQDAVKLTYSLKTTKEDFDLYDKFKAYVAFNDYKTRKDAYEKINETYQGDMDDITQKVDDAYQAVLSAEDTYNDALQTYNTTAETHKINKLKYNLGMVSQIDLMASELAYMKADNDLQKALDNAVLADKKFASSYTIGDVDAAAGQ